MIFLLAAGQRLGHPILGIIIPAVIFAISFFLTYWLYRRFAGALDEKHDSGGESGSPGENSRNQNP